MRIKSLIFALPLSLSVAAQAADSPIRLVNFTGGGGEVSTRELTEPQAPGILDRAYLNYFAVFHGEPLTNLGSAYTVNRLGAPSSSAINFDSDVTAAFMVTPDIGVGADIPFLLVPVMGQGFILGDVGVKAFDKAVVSYRGLGVYANLILQAPTSSGSKAHGEAVGIKMTPFVRYAFPGSRFAVGAWTEEKAYAGVASGKEFKLYAAPYVNYQLTHALSLNLEFEAEAHHDVGQAGTLSFSMYQTDLEPGVIWMITPKVLFNPYLQIFTTQQQVTSDAMALGAVISATVL